MQARDGERDTDGVREDFTAIDGVAALARCLELLVQRRKGARGPFGQSRQLDVGVQSIDPLRRQLREQRDTDCGQRGRELVPDTCRQAQRCPTLVAGKVERIGSLEDGDLHQLVPEDLRVRDDAVELSDLVERGQVGAAELHRAAAEQVPGLVAVDQTGILEHGADVGHGGLRRTEGPGELGKRLRDPTRIAEQLQDLDGTADGRGEAGFLSI